MKKYEKYFRKHEEKKLPNNKIKLLFEIYKYLNKKYGIILTINFFKKNKIGIINQLLLGLRVLNDEDKDFVIENLISKLNKGEVLNFFMYNLTCGQTIKDYIYIKECMISFKKTGLIKDIRFINNTFILEELDGNVIKFKNVLNSEEELKKCSMNCHKITLQKIKKYNDLYSLTILGKSIYGNDLYHSFIIKDDIVYDYARNMKISYKDYRKLFDYKVISCFKGKDILDYINELECIDEEFKNCTYNKVLKYALHVQINSEG